MMKVLHQRIGKAGLLFALLALFTALTVASGSRLATAHDGEEHALPGPHPAHIHSGTCEALGDVVYPLTDIASPAEMTGAASAVPVKTSTTSVAASLTDIMAGEHAINIHESAENIGNYIACGAVGGAMMGDVDLVVGLAALNDSYVSGIATLHDNGDGTTTVNVYLTTSKDDDDEGEDDDSDSADSGDTGATASPVASGAAVEIASFAFNPPSITINVGESVTWTNQDGTAHTATQDGGGFQSDRIDGGGSFTQTFDTAGTFTYHCEFHDGMSGTVIVQ